MLMKTIDIKFFDDLEASLMLCQSYKNTKEVNKFIVMLRERLRKFRDKQLQSEWEIGQKRTRDVKRISQNTLKN